MIIFLFLPIIWPVIGIFVIRFISKKVRFKNKYVKFLLLSLLYSLIFGIGIIGGSNADPGFALPAPVFLAGLLDFYSGNELEFIIRGTFYPLLFWWGLCFIVMLLFDFARPIKNKTQNT